MPKKFHVSERDIILFQVMDRMEEGSARRHVAYYYPGVIRPKLTRETTRLKGRSN